MVEAAVSSHGGGHQRLDGVGERVTAFRGGRCVGIESDAGRDADAAQLFGVVASPAQLGSPKWCVRTAPRPPLMSAAGEARTGGIGHLLVIRS